MIEIPDEAFQLFLVQYPALEIFKTAADKYDTYIIDDLYAEIQETGTLLQRLEADQRLLENDLSNLQTSIRSSREAVESIKSMTESANQRYNLLVVEALKEAETILKKNTKHVTFQSSILSQYPNVIEKLREYLNNASRAYEAKYRFLDAEDRLAFDARRQRVLEAEAVHRNRTTALLQASRAQDSEALEEILLTDELSASDQEILLKFAPEDRILSCRLLQKSPKFRTDFLKISQKSETDTEVLTEILQSIGSRLTTSVRTDFLIDNFHSLSLHNFRALLTDGIDLERKDYLIVRLAVATDDQPVVELLCRYAIQHGFDTAMLKLPELYSLNETLLELKEAAVTKPNAEDSVGQIVRSVLPTTALLKSAAMRLLNKLKPNSIPKA